MARIGEIIDGKYEILREVGRGGMSVVYLAMDKRLNKQWAIKEFRKDKDDVSKQVALKALLDEANLMKKLDHPTLPRIVDIIDNYQTVYVIMDYIEGESLNKVLDAYGAQPQEAVIEWAKQLSEVLDYLHTQSPPVIYRDMKPANIMLKPDGTVRLIDFGIAREYKEGKNGDTEAIGTRGYAAPEQFGGKGQTDARTDIYSLGVTLYHLVTGKNPAEPPYEIYPIRHWNPGLSSGLEWLIQKCTQLNPNDRYQSCAEVTYVLENLDKFEGAYKRKQRTRINLFVASAIMTLVFIISSIGCLFGANYVKSSSYDTLIAEERYIEAIDVDSTRTDAYVGLAKQIGENVDVVIPGEPTGNLTASGTVTTGDLLAWFPEKVISDMRVNDPVDYARIQFELGFLTWENKGTEEYPATPDGVLNDAMPYFEKVIAIAYGKTAGEYAGLTQKQYNLANSFYLVSFFQNNRDKFKENAAGETKELSELQVFAGVDAVEVDGKYVFADSMYASFWNTNLNLLHILNSDAEMTTAVKLATLDRLAYILQENHEYFCEEVSVAEMSEFLSSFAIALDGISDAEEEDARAKAEIKEKINKTIPFIEALYKADLEEMS